MQDHLRRQLRALGASDDDVDRAETQGWLPLLAFERMLMPGRREYDLGELAAASGIDEELARRLWRAVGFPDVPADVALFTRHDVEAARLALEQAPGGDPSRATLLQQVRVISGALARIAAIEAERFAAIHDELHATDVPDDEIALGLLSDHRFADVGRLIDYVHRLQLRAAVWRRTVLAAQPDAVVAVGFADLSGYTRLSAALEPDALSELVGLWEAVAYDTIAASGARVVKTIGDEVMFVGLPEGAVGAALALRDAAAHNGLPPLRIGLAAGPVVSRDGDYFGPVVNLASRLTETAAEGEILAPAPLRDDLPEAARAAVVFGDRGDRQLRDIGTVRVWALTRSG